MPSAQDHLRSHVLRRPAVRKGLAPRVDLLRQAEVDNLAVAIRIDEDVLRLQVAVDDVLGVQVLDAVEDLQEVKLGHVLAHHLHFF